MSTPLSWHEIEAVHDESRARIKSQLRTLGEIVDWTEMVHRDLVLEGRHAKAGQAPLDLPPPPPSKPFVVWSSNPSDSPTQRDE